MQQSVFTNRITIRNLKAHTTYRCKVAAYTTAAGPSNIITHETLQHMKIVSTTIRMSVYMLDYTMAIYPSQYLVGHHKV